MAKDLMERIDLLKVRALCDNVIGDGAYRDIERMGALRTIHIMWSWRMVGNMQCAFREMGQRN